MSDNVIHMPTPVEQAVTTAWRNYLGAESHWADKVFDLALAIKDMREEYKADQDFGKAFDALDLRRSNDKPVNKNERMLLVGVGRAAKEYPDMTRQMLRESQS